MITAIYSLSQVHGAELWLLFWIIWIPILVIALIIVTTQNRKNERQTNSSNIEQ